MGSFLGLSLKSSWICSLERGQWYDVLPVVSSHVDGLHSVDVTG